MLHRPHARSRCTLCARASAVGYLQSCSGLAQETQFDTSVVKITCVQTVIALQTIGTAITHFLKVNTLKQGGSARLEITLQKTHQGEPWGGPEGEGEDRHSQRREMVGDSKQPGPINLLTSDLASVYLQSLLFISSYFLFLDIN